MTPRVQDPVPDTLTLPVEERADLASELLATLEGPGDDPAEVEAAWAAEIEKRARCILSGESAGESREMV